MRKCSLDEELDAATREYDYGIVPGSCTVFVRDTANNVGRLDLTLLEDVLVVIDLTDQGYMVTSCSALSNAGLALATASKAQSHLNKPFETLESLLMAISPLFCQRFQEVLLSKLLQDPNTNKNSEEDVNQWVQPS
ncbi:hypothetical protein LRAMOSA03555 [Lichtheimia ramosa]|uniref:GSKIP domain-containing protein n=1 Tax=Lichtheimia ramosa TaxID=688394 RepID=A0A077WWU8_9FUNG|nr:hypothetical protein LRAMOSA03555 [Lichtheimia ramosa]